MLALRTKVAVLTLVLAAMLPNIARADTLQGQPIYARNNTNSPIWVAAQYVPPGSTSYVTDGWWQVNPGQCVLILYNNGQYIYFSAHNDHGAEWSGNAASGNVRGETVKMFQMDTGTCYDSWTMDFNP